MNLSPVKEWYQFMNYNLWFHVGEANSVDGRMSNKLVNRIYAESSFSFKFKTFYNLRYVLSNFRHLALLFNTGLKLKGVLVYHQMVSRGLPKFINHSSGLVLTNMWIQGLISNNRAMRWILYSLTKVKLYAQPSLFINLSAEILPLKEAIMCHVPTIASFHYKQMPTYTILGNLELVDTQYFYLSFFSLISTTYNRNY